MDNESGQMAEYASAALIRVGLEDYAKILQDALLRCEKLYLPEDLDDPNDDDPRTPWVIWSQGEYLDPFEDLDDRFFELYWANKGEFRKKLFQYVVEHEEEFLDAN